MDMNIDLINPETLPRNRKYRSGNPKSLYSFTPTNNPRHPRDLRELLSPADCADHADFLWLWQ